MRYEHATQNITYDCAAGTDGFLDLKLETADEETITYKNRDVVVVSEVSAVEYVGNGWSQAYEAGGVCVCIHVLFIRLLTI